VTPAPIRVVLVDDSLIALAFLKKMLATAPDIQIVGTAANGREALKLIPAVNPAVICTDLHMPVMDGLELTKEVMAHYPRPVLVVSVSADQGSLNAFKLLEAGALDLITKARNGSEADYLAIRDELVSKIRIVSGVRVFRRAKVEQHEVVTLPVHRELPGVTTPVRIVIIGASTGGPPALQTILSRLPADFSVPIVCVQHISAGFLDGLLQWLAAACALKVALAHNGVTPQGGTIYFPPEGRQLKFDDNGRFVISSDPPYNGHSPSISVTMSSAAECYGNGAAGVLLTGMGNDGAQGMRKITEKGGATIAQDEQSCIIFGMPKQAIALGAARQVLPLDSIAAGLMNMVMP